MTELKTPPAPAVVYTWGRALGLVSRELISGNPLLWWALVAGVADGFLGQGTNPTPTPVSEPTAIPVEILATALDPLPFWDLDSDEELPPEWK